MRTRLPIVPLTLSLLAAVPAHAQYQLPPEPLQAIVDAPRAPALRLSWSTSPRCPASPKWPSPS